MGTDTALPGKFMDSLSGMKDMLFNIIEQLIDIWLFLPRKMIEGVMLIVDKFREFGPMIIQFMQDAINKVVEIIQWGFNLMVDIALFLPTKIFEYSQMIMIGS